MPARSRCGRAKGHRVECADALDYLDRQKDGSIGAIISVQFIEHLPYEALIRFLQLSSRKLAADGFFVAETVNPHSIQAFKALGIFPETLLALCRLYGFAEASVFFPTGAGDVHADQWSQGEYAVAVSRAAGPFLEWWAEHLRRDCLMAPEANLFVDQRFIDFLPTFFAAHVARDVGYNVAYWNLHERRVTWNDRGYEVAGRPLRFFHFSGFNPAVPQILSKHQGATPRTVLTDQRDLVRLCREYADRLLAAGYQQCVSIPYGFANTATGVPLDRRMRRLYREGLLAAERGTHAEPPAPFDPVEASAFIEWTKAPAALEAMPAHSRAALLIHEGPYLGSRSALVRFTQRMLLRMLRPLLIHQESVARALLQTLDDMSQQTKPTSTAPER